MNNKLKHLISLKELNKTELMALILKGLEIKNNPEHYFNACHRKGILMLFQKTSTRTSLSFQSGMNQLGGYAVHMDWDTSNFSISPIQYEARYVSRNTDVIMARLKKHKDLLQLAEYATVPVINGCCDKYHPCQALADLMTIYELAGTFENITITYVGIHNNVVNSLVAGCLTLGIKLLLVTPIINEASWDETLMKEAYKSGYIEKVEQLADAVARTQFIYTDTWVDMEFFQDIQYEHERKLRLQTMMPYQLKRSLFHANAPYIMHDMPVHPGYEIEEALIESEQSIISQQAENRMHVQKALLLYLLNLQANVM